MATKDLCLGGEPEALSANDIGHILARLPRKRKLAVMMMIATDLAQDECEPESSVNNAALMTIAQLQASGRHVTPGWARTHVLEAGRGPRRTPLYRLADVDAALASAARPPRKSRPITSESEDPIDAMLRHGELVARRGR